MRRARNAHRALGTLVPVDATGEDTDGLPEPVSGDPEPMREAKRILGAKPEERNRHVRDALTLVLLALALDQNASASARTSAAKTLADMLGLIRQDTSQDTAKPLSELTESELDELIATTSQRMPDRG